MLPIFLSGAPSVISVIFLVLVLATGCATQRTKYGAYKKEEGYRDLPPEDGLLVTSFKGNPYTKKFDAEVFAKFRAIEVCQGPGKKLTYIMGMKDRSLIKDVFRSSGTGYPYSYYYGTYPFYNHYSSFGIGISSYYSTVYGETYVYPDIAVYFACIDEAMGPELLLREVSAEDMKVLVKDLRGALQVEKILENSPNAGVVEVGDVILRAQGQRVQYTSEFLKLFSREKREIPVEIMREGERKKVTLKSADISESVRKTEEEIVNYACGKEDIRERGPCTRGK